MTACFLLANICQEKICFADFSRVYQCQVLIFLFMYVMNTKEKKAVGNIGYIKVFFMKNSLLSTLFCHFLYFYFWNININKHVFC